MFDDARAESFEFSQSVGFKSFTIQRETSVTCEIQRFIYLSTIERKLGGFGKTPRADPLILSSQEDDRRANSVRLEGGRSNEKYTVKSRTEESSDAEF